MFITNPNSHLCFVLFSQCPCAWSTHQDYWPQGSHCWCGQEEVDVLKIRATLIQTCADCSNAYVVCVVWGNPVHGLWLWINWPLIENPPCSLHHVFYYFRELGFCDQNSRRPYRRLFKSTHPSSYKSCTLGFRLCLHEKFQPGSSSASPG